ncbi:hypothetical protein Ddye_001505 [Dipteronia dyeriana]|uniref:Uncharacterized protein n=1 Tax=Dipteronia dyeriana TaxID=168575 RepID=A0AAD9XP75_9ROSI|nr:hypothetical protein Ddye_001505 [Dipteronia dyeriana]
MSQAMGILFREFLGDASQFYKQTSQEFFEIRYCSFDRRDIDFHYRRMSFLYHALGGINDKSLRQVYLNSLPTELQDKLCATQRVFTKMIKDGRKYDKNSNCLIHITSNASPRTIAIADLTVVPEGNLKRKWFFLATKRIGNTSTKRRRLEDPGTNQTKKYSRPIFAIAYFNTVAHSTMMNPQILPPNARKKRDNEFLAVDGQIFITNLVSK